MQLNIGCPEDVACPFSIITQFDKWFKWHRRVHFNKESRLWVSADMIGIVDRMRRHIEHEFEMAVVKDRLR